MSKTEIKTKNDRLIKTLVLEVELLLAGFDIHHMNRFSYEAEKAYKFVDVRFIVDVNHVRIFVNDQIISQELVKYFSLKRVLNMPFIAGVQNGK